MGESKSRNDVDILQYIGELGVYQVTLFLLLAAGIYYGSIDSIMMNFIGGFQDHWCYIPQLQNFSHAQQKYIAIPFDPKSDQGVSYSSCEQFDLDWSSYSFDDFVKWNRSQRTGGVGSGECTDGWVFDRSQFVTTLGSEMGLVCDQRWKVEFLSTIYMFGRLIGAITCGFVSDLFGRKKAILLFHTVRVAGALSCVYAQDYWLFATGRFVMAVGSTGSTLCAYVLLTEFLNNRMRGIFGILWHVCFGLGFSTVCVCAYFMRDYQYYQMLTTWPLLIFYIYIVAIPESPLWLISKGRVKEALEVVQHACLVNHLPVPQAFTETTDNPGDQQGNHGKDNPAYDKDKDSETATTSPTVVPLDDAPENQATFLDLFRTPNLRRYTLINFFVWFSNSLVYYGLTLNTGRLPGNIYVTTFFMAFIEVPANLIGIFFVNWAGRKWTVGVASLLAGLSSLTCVFLITDSQYDNVVTGLAIFGKGSVTASFAGVYLYSAEIFPTPVRNIGLGAASMCSRVSGMLAPFVGGPLEDVWKPLPSLIFGVTATLASILMFTMPETLGRTLPETIEDAENFSKQSVASTVTEISPATDEREPQPPPYETLYREEENSTRL